MKRFKDFYAKHKTGSLKGLVLLFSCLGILFSYLYGVSNSDVNRYANLMVLDYEAKQQNINFIHGYVELDSSLDGKEKYNKNINLQYKTIFKQKLYNSYLLSSSSAEIIQYDSTIYRYSTKTPISSLGEYQLARVRNYWDYKYMESIGLPLFYINENTSKNNIGSKKQGINYGCYISSTQAFDIGVELGLLEKQESDLKVIREAFNKIIAPDNDYYLHLKKSGREPIFTINNIYINSERFVSLLNNEQLADLHRTYGDYYKSFAFWNKNTIFTNCDGSNVFSSGSLLCFDIRGSYNNIYLFMNEVIGKNYVNEGSTVHFQSQNKSLDSLSKNINDAYANTKKGNLVFLLVSILFFELLMYFQITLISTKSPTRKSYFLKAFLPSIPFALLWLIVSMMLMSSSTYALSYAVFNYIGNGVSLVFLTVVILSGVLWNKFGEDDEKII